MTRRTPGSPTRRQIIQAGAGIAAGSVLAAPSLGLSGSCFNSRHPDEACRHRTRDEDLSASTAHPAKTMAGFSHRV